MFHCLSRPPLAFVRIGAADLPISTPIITPLTHCSQEVIPLRTSAQESPSGRLSTSAPRPCSPAGEHQSSAGAGNGNGLPATGASLKRRKRP